MAIESSSTSTNRWRRYVKGTLDSLVVGGSDITVQDEGTNLTTLLSKINFAGAGVTATEPTTNEILVTIPGGGTTYNITDNSDATFLTVDASENSVFTGTVEATKYYIDDTAAEDGKPSLRLEYDNTTGEYDWMLSRGVQIVAGEYELAVAGNSPAGVFFHGEGSGNGLAILAAGNHDSLAAGTVLPRPESFSPGASVRVTGLAGYIDLITNGTTRARVSDANFQIDDLLVTGNTTLKKVTETKVALSGTTPAVDLDTGTVFTHTVAATTTFTFTNPGAVASFTLIITNGGSQTVNWPASVDWAGGTAPTLTTAGVDVLTFVTPDTGTTWYGFVGGLDMK